MSGVAVRAVVLILAGCGGLSSSDRSLASDELMAQKSLIEQDIALESDQIAFDSGKYIGILRRWKSKGMGKDEVINHLSDTATLIGSSCQECADALDREVARLK